MQPAQNKCPTPTLTPAPTPTLTLTCPERILHIVGAALVWIGTRLPSSAERQDENEGDDDGLGLDQLVDHHRETFSVRSCCCALPTGVMQSSSSVVIHCSGVCTMLQQSAHRRCRVIFRRHEEEVGQSLGAYVC